MKFYCEFMQTNVMVVECRTLPEYSFDTLFSDCVFAFDWVAANAHHFGVKPTNIGVGGISGGGAIATNVSIHLVGRRDSLPVPAFQFLLVPGLDGMNSNRQIPSIRMYGQNWDFGMKTQTSKTMGDKEYEKFYPKIKCSVTTCPYLQDLPPLFLLTAHFDPMRDISEAYMNCMKKIGGEVVYWYRTPTSHFWFDLVNTSTIHAKYLTDACVAV